MSKFYIFLYFIIGASALFDFFSTILGYNSSDDYSVLSFESSKLGYLIFKFILGGILITAGFLEIKKGKSKKK
ncbi:hypothetical protein JYU17_00630 [Flavobacteriaceae bacterium AH-315-O20]|nr:hypothetical protein [Flavobacteriaceae bacterium AH-315-O20]